MAHSMTQSKQKPCLHGSTPCTGLARFSRQMAHATSPPQGDIIASLLAIALRFGCGVFAGGGVLLLGCASACVPRVTHVGSPRVKPPAAGARACLAVAAAPANPSRRFFRGGTSSRKLAPAFAKTSSRVRCLPASWPDCPPDVRGCRSGRSDGSRTASARGRCTGCSLDGRLARRTSPSARWEWDTWLTPLRSSVSVFRGPKPFARSPRVAPSASLPEA